MKIEIKTDGDSRGTSIYFNGVRQSLMEFSFSVRAGRKAKLQLKRVDTKTRKVEFLSYFSEDFKKFAEVLEDKAEIIGDEGGDSKRI